MERGQDADSSRLRRLLSKKKKGKKADYGVGNGCCAMDGMAVEAGLAHLQEDCFLIIIAGSSTLKSAMLKLIVTIYFHCQRVKLTVKVILDLVVMNAAVIPP